MPFKNSNPTLVRTGLLVLALLVLTGCSAAKPDEPLVVESTIPVLPTSTSEVSEPLPSATPEGSEAPGDAWVEYTNQNFQFRFSYPAAWFGPDAYESDGSLRLAIGSDVVYPYGTSREDQINTVPDSYFITIQYNQNQSNMTWDDLVNSGWITSYLELKDQPDGATSNTARSLVIRVGEVSLGSFTGLEYIFTLPDTAQTERVYGREIVAFDENLNMLRVMGTPNLVTISDESNWKADYQRVDEAYQEIFRTVVGSIVLE